MKLGPADLAIDNLGTPRVKSPLSLSQTCGDGLGDFVPDDARVLFEIETSTVGDRSSDEPLVFEKAGPRAQLYFDPAQTTAAIVTCGGLSPGLNTVIRSAFLELHYRYRVAGVLGIRFGFQGLHPQTPCAPVKLTPEFVDRIHLLGGTVLGSSRGEVPTDQMVDSLTRLGVKILLCVGGDGTQRGALAIYEEASRRGVELAVVGIPKTIDNDVAFIDRTFGYVTALEQATQAVLSAHVEANGAPNGISVVKVMGRDAGFIAAGATLASQEVNFTLVPEVPFPLEGPGGFLEALEQRIKARAHAVIVAAEGAGQHLMSATDSRDASGNRKHADIGPFLCAQIKAHFAQREIPVNVKYIDPSYLIRSVPANCEDSLLCDVLARNAVHAGMAGKTGLVVGMAHNRIVHVPIATIGRHQKRMSTEGDIWCGVMATTGQPAWEQATPVCPDDQHGEVTTRRRDGR
jgi:6-phosphofructokinase 1